MGFESLLNEKQVKSDSPLTSRSKPPRFVEVLAILWHHVYYEGKPKEQSLQFRYLKETVFAPARQTKS